LSIAENIYIHKYEKGKFFKTVDRKKLVGNAEKILEEWGIQIDAGEKVAHVSMGIRQLVEIARELSTGGKVIILDEPTSSLTVSEIKKLFEVVRKLKKQGLTIIFISHRLDEVIELVDRLTVLRDGVVVGCAPTKDMSPGQICTMIAGTDISNLYPKIESSIGEIALKAKDFTGKGFSNISLNVRWGEIVGLVGLIGAGRSEVCRAIFGLDKCENGILHIKGKRVNIKNSGMAVKKRIALLSEDREAEGIFPELSVALNTIMLKIKNILKNSIINKKLIRKVANQKVDELNIVTFNSERQIISELSGGNQQKVLFAQLLALDPEILILDEPTRGVDVGNKTEIHKIMGNFVKDGGAILMVSSELDEVLGICDRIYVLHEGDLVAEFNRNNFEKEKTLRCMMGIERIA